MSSKEREKKSSLRGGALIFIIVMCLLFSFFNKVYAEELSTVAQIEQAIFDLTEPFDAEHVGRIRAAIIEQGQQDQRSLNQALDARIKDFFKLEEHSSITAQLFKDGNLSPEEIMMQINFLTLGANAPISDLRKRDYLVAMIANIKDPNQRYELLQYLENKEKSFQ